MLKCHFLNVGKGSSTIVEFPLGRVGIVDIDDSRAISDDELEALAWFVGEGPTYEHYASFNAELVKSRVEEAYNIELCDPIAYYKTHIGKQAWRFILTHPDMDHMSGLKRFYDEIGSVVFWDTANNKEMSEEDWDKSPYNKEDWDWYQDIRRRQSNPQCIRPMQGDLERYWREDGVEILAPSRDLVELANDNEEYNHTSYVLKVTHAGRSVLLGGDASKEVWDDILVKLGPEALKADVLLAPHHGSKNNFHKDAMEAVAPSLVIVSVEVGKDYAYDDYRRLKSSPKVVATKWVGNVIVEIQDDGHCTYTLQYDR